MKYAEALEQQLALLRQVEGELRTGPAREVIHDVYHCLVGAQAFYWDRIPTGLALRGAKTLYHWSLDRTALPCESGFMWFGEIVPIYIDATLGGTDLYALAWTTLPEGVQVCSFGHFREELEQTPVPGFFAPPVWRWGEDFPGEWPWGGDPNSEAARSLSVYAGRLLRFWASSLLFINQRILVTRPERLDRAARRRLEREAPQHNPIVRIVELRKKEVRDRPDGDGDPVDWHCRWLVSGHWRQQWFPSAQRHQPVWITPYVKGPEDKPLKEPAAKVFAVVR